MDRVLGLGARRLDASIVAFGTTRVGVLDPRAQLVDADARRPRDRRRRAHRGELVGGDLQSVVPVPPRRTCCSPRASPRRSSSPGSRRGGCCKAPQRCGGAEDAALRRAHRGGAGAAADLRRRPARPEHARAPAGQDRGDGGDLADRARRAAHAVRHSRTRRSAATTSRSGAEGARRSSSRTTPNGEVKGLDEFEDTSAGGAGVLRLPRHGRHGRADAARSSWTGSCVLAAARARRAGCCGRSPAFTFSGWVATLAGWLVTEIGRQPWLVTGILRTADAVGRRQRRRSSARASPPTC